MWDQLRRTDHELAKRKLAELRTITLHRPEEELRQIDADEAEVEMLGRLAVAVTQIPSSWAHIITDRHTGWGKTCSSSIDRDSRAPEAQQGAEPPGIEAEQQVSPNFGIPLRRFVGR
jgi:hypothetical protein